MSVRALASLGAEIRACIMPELAVGGEVLVALASRDVDLGLSFRQIAPRERLGQDRFRPRDNPFAPQFQEAQRAKQADQPLWSRRKATDRSVASSGICLWR